MKKIILASHGELAQGMKKTVEMIAGEHENLYAISMLKENGPQDVLEIAKKYLEEDKESDFVILTDLPGGSVNTALSVLIKEERCHLVSGMNIMLVLDILLSDEQDPIDRIITTAIENARETIQNIRQLMQNNCNEGDLFDD